MDINTVFEGLRENKKILSSLSEDVSMIKEQVKKNKNMIELIKSDSNSSNRKILLLERSAKNNKYNILTSIDNKISKLSKNIRTILANENGKANEKLNDVKIHLDKLYRETKRGLNTHDGNFSKLNSLLEQYEDVAKFIHVQSKNGMTLRRLGK